MESNSVLLRVRNLRTHFLLDEGLVRAVDDVSFEVPRGQILGLVGESGCGKSVTARSILGLVRPPGRVVEGEVLYERQLNGGSGPGVTETVDLRALDPEGAEIRDIRGGEIAMIFQEPMATLSPVHSVGNQIMEAIRLHQDVSKKEARNRAIELLRRVGIPRVEERIDEYSFRLSGGMRQRAMIAIALSCNPSLLIADEPTTALDVTTQAQILELILELQEEVGMAVLLITHNLGVVAQMAQRVVVMYLGKVVEEGEVEDLFERPQHPYTQALLKSIPKATYYKQTTDLATIEGSIPSPYSRPEGCSFHPRCPQFMSGICDTVEPELLDLEPGHKASCLLYDPEYARRES